jgi:3D (Asp-Asp-Asp) domain-containing protein
MTVYIRLKSILLACFTIAVAVVPVAAARASGGGAALTGGAGPSGASAAAPVGSGGVPIGGLDPTPKSRKKRTTSNNHKLVHGTWFHGVSITEYWPAPESWFVGRLVNVPGLPTKHRIDWLYSATGVSMEGEGLGLDGRMYHIDALGDGGWVTADGSSTSASGGWSSGAPFWRTGGYWSNQAGGVTFPFQRGGWFNGSGRHYVALPHVTFAPGASLPLHVYQSIAVDPSVIPLGSEVYVPAYAHDGHGGWFVAQDTGGAITGRHIDVYRSPPASSSDTGRDLTGEKMYVVPPRH